MSEIVKTLLKDVGIDFDTSVVITDIHEEKVEKERIATKKRAKQKLRRKKLAEKTKLNKSIFEEKIPQKDIDGSKTSKLLKEIGVDFAPRKPDVEKIKKVEEIDKIPFPEVKCHSGLAKEKQEKEEIKYGYTVKKEILDTSGIDDIINVFDGNYVVSRPDFSNEDMISPATEKITDQKSKESLIEISPLHQELDLFKKHIMEQVFRNTSAAVGNLSGAGGGEVRLEFLDDIDRDTAKVNNKFLKYQSSSGKWIGAEAGSSTTVTVTDNESTNEHNAIVFVADADLDGGTVELESDGDLKYNPNSGTVTATTFSGALSGNATTATALATGRTIGMTGDVVWTSASFTGSGNVTATATIQANSVDGTMIALGSDASGDVMYYNGTNYIRLARGSDDEVLTLASGVPSWAAAGGGGAALTGSTNNTITTVTGANAFQGEANLTFDGSTLAVTGAITGTTDLTLGDDLILDSDSAVIQFGDDQEIKLTHVHNTGLSITSTAAAPLVRRGEDVFIVLNQTAAAGTDAGDNVIMDRSASDGTDAGDDIIGEDQVFLHSGMQRDVINIVDSAGTIKKSIAGFSAGTI